MEAGWGEAPLALRDLAESMNGKKEELLQRLTEAIREMHSESIDNNKLN